MKKIISLLLVVVMLAAVPVTSFAELTDVQKSAELGTAYETLVDSNLALGYTACGWSPSGGLSTQPGTAQNFLAEDGYTWVKFLIGAWGSAEFNNIGIYKDFSPISAGEGLKLSAVVKPLKNMTEQTQTIEFNLTDSEGNKIFQPFIYKAVPQVGYTAGIANGSSTLSGWDISAHAKDVVVSVDIQSANDKYRAKAVLTEQESGTILLEAEPVMLEAADALNIASLRINASASWYISERPEEANVIGIKNVSVEKTNDSILFADTGIRLNEKLTDISNFTNLYIDETNEIYLNGNMWQANDTTAYHSPYVREDDYMWAKHHTSLSQNVGYLRKLFKPAGDGQTIKVSFEFKPYQEADGVYPSNYMRAGVTLKNPNDSSQKLELFKVIFPNNSSGYSINVCNTNTEATQVWHFNQYQVLNRAKDYRYDMTLTPRADGNYDAVYTVTNVTDGSEVAKLSGECELDGTLVKSLSQVELESYAGWGETDASKNKKLLGIRNLLIETIDDSKTGLTAGKNMIYIPYRKTNNAAMPVVICAAVFDKTTEVMNNAFVMSYTDELVRNTDNAAIEVDITNPETEYVKVFAFDSLGSIIPLMKDKATK